MLKVTPEKSTEKISQLRINPDKFIILSVVWHYVFNFVLIGRFPINITPILVGVLGYPVFIYLKGVSIEKGLIISWISLTLLSALALMYLFMEKGASSLLSMEFMFFIYLPLLYLATARLTSHGYLYVIVNALLAFVWWQLFVVVGQVSMRLSGIGFHLPSYYYEDLSDNYSSMLSGTFLNANDLAAVCGMLFVFFSLIRAYMPRAAKIGMSVCLILAVLTLSRLVFVFMIISMVVFFLRRSVLKGAILALLVGLGLSASFHYAQEYLAHLDFISRIVGRVESLWFILDNGILEDNSMFLRVSSYIHFLANLDSLGLGSMHFRDYSSFVNSLGSKYELMSVNPHSFIVEIGYWLGWSGLFLLISFMVGLKPKNLFGYLYVLLAFILLSMVSSSVVNNFMFFVSLFSALAVTVSKVKSNI